MTGRSRDLYELRSAALSAEEHRDVLTGILDELQYAKAAPVLLKLFGEHGPLSFFQAVEIAMRRLPKHSQFDLVKSILRLINEGKLYRLESGLISFSPEEEAQNT